MLTCCPQCGTTFRVSPQQLKVHQGEVRCGRCSAVFDAFDSLLAEPAETGLAIEPATAAGAAAEPEASAADSPEAASAQPAQAAAAEAPAPQERRRELRELLPQSETAATAAPAKAFAARGKPAAHWPWLAVSVLAAVALAGQLGYRYRGELAATWPDTRPWLERACAELRCGVALPRHIELVSIDASDLQVDTAHSNLMLLTATLKNRAPFAQEHPALALTLTDTQDQPLARRVLTPADYLERKADNRAGFAANAEFAVKVYIDSREVKATGYRLFLFYP